MGHSPMKWKPPASLKVWQRCTRWHRTRTVNFPLFIRWSFQPNNGVTCLLDFRIFEWYKHVLSRRWSNQNSNKAVIYRSGNYCARLRVLAVLLLLWNSNFETSVNIFNSVWHIPEFRFYQAISHNFKMRTQSVLDTSETFISLRGCLPRGHFVGCKRLWMFKWEINGPHFMRQHYVLRQCREARIHPHFKKSHSRLNSVNITAGPRMQRSERFSTWRFMYFFCVFQVIIEWSVHPTPDMLPYKLSGIILLCAL
jgi:hypothetical protein